MLLESLDGARLDLSIVSYQFNPPTSTTDHPAWEWDANWLMVRGVARTADDLAWEFLDPCMTTHEVRDLGAWLLAVATPSTALDPDGPSFTEPNLEFTVDPAGTVAGHVTLAVRFTAECAPRPSHVADEGFVMNLTIPQAAVVAASRQWEAECAAFPSR